MSAFRMQFDTVRDLEKKTFRVFAYGGAALAVGFVFLLFGMLMIGIPLVLISGSLIIAAIAWVSILGKERTRSIFCPHCSSTNDVYASRRGFSCGICGRDVTVNELGEPAAVLDSERGQGY